MLKFFIINLCFLPVVSAGATISTDSQKLGYCEFVYFYYAQLMQMKNNEGAAKNYLRRSSMMTVSNFMILEENGTVSGKKIHAFRKDALERKKEFDKNSELILGEVAACDENVISITTKIRQQNKILWNKSFDELQLEFYKKSLATLGIG